MAAKVSNGYKFEDEWINAANGEYLFAEKDGKQYFLKRFREPKYPREGSSKQYFESQLKECEEWRNNRREVIAALKKVSSGGGNIVSPLEIFLEKPMFMQATRKVDTSSIDYTRLISVSEDDLVLLLKTLINSMNMVHSVNVIHGDLKPENILISKTPRGRLVCKIIDFDDSYFSENPPLPSYTVGTQSHYSPELGIYRAREDDDVRENKKMKQILTCKSDIFALGLIIHQYCSGGKLPDLQGHNYAYEAVCSGKVLEADSSIKPIFLQKLINQMLLFEPASRPSCEEALRILQNPSGMENQDSKEKEKTIIKVKKGEQTEKQKKSIDTDDFEKRPHIEKTRNPNKVKVLFGDGSYSILETSFAKSKGWI